VLSSKVVEENCSSRALYTDSYAGQSSDYLSEFIQACRVGLLIADLIRDRAAAVSESLLVWLSLPS